MGIAVGSKGQNIDCASSWGTAKLVSGIGAGLVAVMIDGNNGL